MGSVFPPHVPEDHRQSLFAGLGAEYGSVEEQGVAGLWVSVALDECRPCLQRLVWPLAKDVGAMVSLARVFRLLVTGEGPSGESTGLVEVTRLMPVEDRVELAVEVANDVAAQLGTGHREGCGPGCAGCVRRRARLEAVRASAAAA